LYKRIYRLGCHIKKTKAGKYNSACAEHITKFTVSMSHGSKREGVRQRKLQQLRNELVIKDKKIPGQNIIYSL